MSLPAFRVRRATVDDLQGLLALWGTMEFPAPELEKRLTEFQIAETNDGILLGALALEIAGRHGRVHSEGFTDFALSDALRQQLWERLQSLATNHGLTRLWTRESAPFWKQNGFQSAGADALKKLPIHWDAAHPDWRTLKLRDEEAVEAALEKEFARFKVEEQQRVGKTLRRAKAMKFLATLLAVLLFIGVSTFAFFWVMRNYPNLFRR